MNILNKEWNRVGDLFAKQTIEKSKFTQEKYYEIAKPRKYFSAQEALELGFIDEINDKWIESL